jgi:hypothetical protein
VSSAARTIARADRRQVSTMPLFAATIFLAAGLVFLVQPLVAKMLLPVFGGTPAVWAVSLVFFQAVLLAGYCWAHLSLRFLPLRRQPFVQLPLLLAPFVLLPIGFAADADPGSRDPALWLLGVLTLAVGLPFLAVSTASPVLQRWFSATGHGASGDPYFLYAASNAGSLIGLLSYPLVLEPRLTLEQQSRVWLLGYAVFVGLAALCALRVFSSREALPVQALRPAAAPSLTWRTRIRWTAMAALPSSLILGTTSHLSTSIASVPLLWVVPLAVYLVTYILAFARSAPLSPRTVATGVVTSSLLVAGTLLQLLRLPIAALVAILCANLFFVALLVHRRLASERPPVERLTEFYLLLSLGGVLGGAFNALVAPQLFDSIAEYPLALTLALLVLPGAKSLRRDAPVVVVYCGAVLVALVAAGALGTVAIRAALAGAVLSLLLFHRRPARLAGGLALLLGLATFGVQSLHAERTFFGVLTVTDGPNHERLLAHGITVHGAQSLDPARRDEPLAYYTRQGPLGQLFTARRGRFGRVGVIGLGAGAVAAYGRAGDDYVFYELDRSVARIATDRRWFTFLSDSPANVRIVIGDGRLELARARPAGFDLIVLDAFSSDSVPVHLLTKEALELYLAKLAPGGVIALHITNNHLEMEPVVAAVAASLGLVGVAQEQHVSTAAEELGARRSHWVTLARDPGSLGRLASDPRWHPLEARPGDPVWTDQFSNILSVVDWRR